MDTLTLLPEHAAIVANLKFRDTLILEDPRQVYRWWRRPCKVRVLLLTDGFLDFGTGGFGLSTFVTILANEMRHYLKFELTIAHRGSQVGIPGVSVARSIPTFRFTNPDHFTTSMYDQVWLFGADSNNGSLSNDELLSLADFMNGGGGVFATGDHGALGRGLCSQVLRVRHMRLWDNASGEVGMSDPRRNDTNRIGHDAGSQFDDQSDDIPQTIAPKLYSSYFNAFWRETYPHPLLCSSLGRITVLPDHPHEGECVAPANLDTTYIDDSPEFPGGVGPEVIAYSTVPAGNTSGTKQHTQQHTFGAISAYDGHSVDRGRVVTDATWHHFVNINLVGAANTTGHPSKLVGFLASTAGQQHLAQIKHYFVNIGSWLARPAQQRCFNSHYIWHLTFHHRVMEATMNQATIAFDRIDTSLLYEIGTHALDVLGKEAGQCRRLKWTLWLLKTLIRDEDFGTLVDPWIPSKRPGEKSPLLPWLTLEPLFGITTGAGLIAIRDRFFGKDIDSEEVTDDEIVDIFTKGAQRGLKLSGQSLERQLSVIKAFR